MVGYFHRLFTARLLQRFIVPYIGLHFFDSMLQPNIKMEPPPGKQGAHLSDALDNIVVSIDCFYGFLGPQAAAADGSMTT